MGLLSQCMLPGSGTSESQSDIFRLNRGVMWRKRSQYTSKAFTEFCEEKQITQSMSRAGCAYDNSPTESFYGTFKAEFIGQNSFETDIKLNKSTSDYVYGYYNHICSHSSNGYMTLFEKRYTKQ